MTTPFRMPPPSTSTAMLRGLLRKCPQCGIGPMFRTALKLADSCAHCGEKLGHIRADDIPAYFTILVVGHIVVPLLLVGEAYDLSSAVELGISIPLAIALVALMLPTFKGAIAGLLWSLRMSSGVPNTTPL